MSSLGRHAAVVGLSIDFKTSNANKKDEQGIKLRPQDSAGSDDAKPGLTVRSQLGLNAVMLCTVLYALHHPTTHTLCYLHDHFPPFPISLAPGCTSKALPRSVLAVKSNPSASIILVIQPEHNLSHFPFCRPHSEPHPFWSFQGTARPRTDAAIFFFFFFWKNGGREHHASSPGDFSKTHRRHEKSGSLQNMYQTTLRALRSSLWPLLLLHLPDELVHSSWSR